MPHSSTDLAYTTVKHCFSAGTSGVPANAALVSRFGVHHRETLCRCRHQRNVCKCCTCQRIWRTPPWNTGLAQATGDILQMLHLSADLAYTTVKHCVGAGTKRQAAKAALVSGFGAHVGETIYLFTSQWNVCKCFTCRKIWFTPPWSTVFVHVPTECLQTLHLSAGLAYTYVKHRVCAGSDAVSLMLHLFKDLAHMFRKRMRLLCGVIWQPKNILKLYHVVSTWSRCN